MHDLVFKVAYNGMGQSGKNESICDTPNHH